MSIEDYTDRLLRRIDKAFEDAANGLFSAAKVQDHGRCTFLAGKMDALNQAAQDIKEVRKLYMQEDTQEEEKNESQPLY